jgi:hypothetical protein
MAGLHPLSGSAIRRRWAAERVALAQEGMDPLGAGSGGTGSDSGPGHGSVGSIERLWAIGQTVAQLTHFLKTYAAAIAVAKDLVVSGRRIFLLQLDNGHWSEVAK